MDAGESHLRSSLGTLKNCLVGSWKERSDALPSVKEVESWAKAVWRLKGGLMVAVWRLNDRKDVVHAYVMY